MAVYYGNSSLNANYRGRLEFTETTNVNANTSTISWTFKIYRADGYSSSYDRSYGNHFTLTVDGSQVYSNTDFRVYMANATSEGSAWQCCSGSFTVTHNADGAKAFSFSAKYWNTESSSIGSSGSPLTVSGTHTCITIPRASSVSATNATMGASSTITVSRASSSFTHTLTYSFGSTSGTIATGVATSYTWSVPISLANQIPNSKTGTCTITCITYSGSTQIGTKITTITLTVPSSAAPSLSVSSAVVDGFSGHYLQGKSKCKLTFTASGQYGASISSRTVNGTAVSSPWTSGVLTSSGTVTYTCAVTDSRGYSKSVSVSISVDAYSNPMLTAVSVFRCNSGGTAADDGTYISAKATANYSTVGGTNSATLTYKYRVKNGAWSAATTMTSGTASVFGAGAISITSSYEVLLTITDSVGNSAQTTITIPTSTVMLDFRPNMDGMGIGRYAESANGLLVNPNWTVDMGRSKNAYGEISWSTGYQAGTQGYLRIATVKITQAYANSPIKFQIFRRQDYGVTTMYLKFANGNTVDPSLDALTYESLVPVNSGANAFSAFATKTATSTWDIYVRKAEAYDSISVVTTFPDYMLPSQHATITYSDNLLTSIPTGAVQATPLYGLVSATRANLRSGDYSNYRRYGNIVLINFFGTIADGVVDLSPLVTGLPPAVAEAFGSLLNMVTGSSYAVSLRDTNLVARQTFPSSTGFFAGQVMYFAKE